MDFFLNLHSEISYPTTFSETVQRDDTNFGPFLFYSVAKWRLKYGKRQPVAMEENSRQTRKKQPFLYIVMAGLPSFKNGLECDYPWSTTERSEGPTERSDGVC